jgi:hypothetical protein
VIEPNDDGVFTDVVPLELDPSVPRDALELLSDWA